MKLDSFFSGDENQLRSEMSQWLKAVANAFFDGSLDADTSGIALCMPIDPQFESDQLAITPLGSRNRDWLYETSKDGHNGRDFFAWWEAGLNADYYLGRALTQMWSDVRWRLPVNDFEREVLADVVQCLRNAYRLDPTLQYPWAEWKELLDLVDVDKNERALIGSHAQGIPKIGYRRGNIRADLSGGWTIAVPGSFSDFESDEENNLYAFSPPREVWFTSYRSKATESSKAFASAKKEMRKDHHEYLIERDDYMAHCKIVQKRNENNEDYFVLSSSMIAPGKQSVCTIVFSETEQRDWALETWRSIRPPFVQNS